ncbi:hypothetical protein ACFC34_00590 [Streptomyces sp. NPDC056053]|uniref:hypothetical protein n=1 Tax=Streptomyces sp. NPDC056053 TaxID=3345696 RepID=UPI0035D8EC38
MTARAVKPVKMRVVPADGDGTPIVEGEFELDPIEPDAEGRYVVQTDVVKRALVTWLREVADEIEQDLDAELGEESAA